jgi:hypothetical protein
MTFDWSNSIVKVQHYAKTNLHNDNCKLKIIMTFFLVCVCLFVGEGGFGFFCAILRYNCIYITIANFLFSGTFFMGIDI